MLWDALNRASSTDTWGLTALMWSQRATGVSVWGMGVSSLVIMRDLSRLEGAAGVEVLVDLVGTLLLACLAVPVAEDCWRTAGGGGGGWRECMRGLMLSWTLGRRCGRRWWPRRHKSWRRRRRGSPNDP